jgi:hypothetical protein
MGEVSLSRHHGKESGNPQEMRDALARIRNPQLTAPGIRQVEHAHELANAGGVDVRYPSKIQNDSAVAAFQEGRHVVTQVSVDRFSKGALDFKD